MIIFIGFNKIFGDLGLTFCFLCMSTVILILIWIISILLYTELYYPYIKKPICEYIRKRNERLMIKIYSNLKLRGNSKLKYLKL